ncbi:hypothetical protein TRVA0_005S04082 [Trichomonascus vanleenenianus]|uniref:cyclin CLN3 n=1 Tax=Trichomonascus vanleenenianus TaxID=2268995 RepID=UPI003ECA9B27
MTSEYEADIFAHIAQMQQATLPDVSMIETQPELSWSMRPYLLDFMIESHQELALKMETLYLAVNILDRYASKRIVYKRHYQLVGCTALWIASKYYDKNSYVPTLEELKLLCCGAYEKHMFVQMESHILSTLEWTLGHPTVDGFVDLFNESCGGGLLVRSIALYLCEMALYDRELIAFGPCATGYAAVVLTNLLLNNGKTVSPTATSPEQEEEYYECTRMLARLVLSNQVLSVIVNKKYSSQRYLFAASVVRGILEKGTSTPVLTAVSTSALSIASASPSLSYDEEYATTPDYAYTPSPGVSPVSTPRSAKTPDTPLSTATVVKVVPAVHAFAA